MLYEKVLRYAVLAVSKNKIEGESNLLRRTTPATCGLGPSLFILFIVYFYNGIIAIIQRVSYYNNKSRL